MNAVLDQKAPMDYPTGVHPLAYAVLIPTDQIDLDPTQPRQDWRNDDQQERLLQLADNIKEYGILQPIRVRRVGDRYMVVSGARRRQAAGMAKMPAIPAIIEDEPAQRRAEPEELRRLILQLSENLQRHNISQHDEGRAYGRLVREFNMTPPQIALKVRRTDTYVRELIRVTGNEVLNEATGDDVRLITMSDAREIMKLPDKEREECIVRVKAGQRVTKKDVDEIRKRLTAQGIVNPRMSPRVDRPTPSASLGSAGGTVADRPAGSEDTPGTGGLDALDSDDLRSVSEEQIRRMADSLVEGARRTPPRTDKEAYRQISDDYNIYRGTMGTSSQPAAPPRTDTVPDAGTRERGMPTASSSAPSAARSSPLAPSVEGQEQGAAEEEEEEDGASVASAFNRFAVAADATPVERIVALMQGLNSTVLLAILDTAYENGISLPGLARIVRESSAS